MTVTAGSTARWIIASGEEVFLGDHVALARHPDSVGRIVGVDKSHLGWPAVELTEGPQAGKVVPVLPSDILVRVRTGR
ncbi:hypothetical protein CS0771_13870 [Catellatospora sp. IY07-71]|uniref:Uncharacterized protein n=1 Tax=Catellatospora bangladeshensis TaxID=310355 RepID=A0A8J3NKY2_9ACTN|nr:hypothetical protein CS0771_13870 [Catellatospora sp. IY07-71]GIF84477.1 hypothetical protein Cba03nite_58260 [Catellatospora bangladeshensis]